MLNGWKIEHQLMFPSAFPLRSAIGMKAETIYDKSAL